MPPHDLQPDLRALDREIGMRIRLCRRARRLTREDLGDVVGDTAARVADYEAGREPVGAVRLYEISVALSVDVEALFPTLAGDPRPVVRRAGDLGLVK